MLSISIGIVSADNFSTNTRIGSIGKEWYRFISTFSPTASNFIIAGVNHVHTYFNAKKAGYNFTAQQMSLAPQKWR